MSRYRKFDPRFWKDEKIRQLSVEEKAVAAYCFTGQSNRVGLFNFSPGQAAEDLGVSPATFAKGFRKVCQRLNYEWDEDARVLYLPTWWKYNAPDNPNTLKGNLSDIDGLPETRLFARFSTNLAYLAETLHPTFHKALAKRLPKPAPNQDQDQDQDQKQKQEQEQEQEQDQLLPPSSAATAASPEEEFKDSPWLISFLKEQTTFNGNLLLRLIHHDFWGDLSEACNGIDANFLRVEFAAMSIWIRDNRRKAPTPNGVRRFVTNWLRKAAERRRRAA